MDKPTTPESDAPKDCTDLPAAMIASFDKDKAHTYVELAKICQESFFNRRAMEWKVGFGLWTAIGLITYFLTTNAQHFSETLSTQMVWLYVSIAVIWQVFFHAPIRSGFEADRNFKHYYMHRAEGRSPEWPLDFPVTRWRLFKERQDGRWRWSLRTVSWLLGQFLFTVALLCGSWFIIEGAISKSSHADEKVESKVSAETPDVKTELNT